MFMQLLCRHKCRHRVIKCGMNHCKVCVSDEALSSEIENEMASDTFNDDVLLSENEEILVSDDEMITETTDEKND